MVIWGSRRSLVTSGPQLGPGPGAVEVEQILLWTPHELCQELYEPESPHPGRWQDDKFV